MKVCFVGTSERCSLNCEHCYLDKKDKPSDLSNSLAKTFFKQVSVLKPRIIGLEGDHLQLDKIVEEAIKNSLEVTVSASSNYLREDIIKKLNNKIKSLVISLDGHNAEIHDKIRGTPGSFNKTIEIIKYAQKIGIHVSVLCALSNRNLSELENIIRFVSDLKTDVISFLYTSSFGRAEYKNLSIPINIWKDVCHKLEILRRESTTRVFYEPVFCNNSFDKRKPCALYTRDYMAIDSVGNIYFCPLFINKENGKYALGNLSEEKLEDIWFRSPKWKEFRKMKQNLDTCIDCTEHDDCGGECFANLALKKTKSNYPKAVCYMHWIGLP